jgi:hypothetical protein
VLEQHYDGTVRFAHPTTLSYFASCFLVRHQAEPKLWIALVAGNWVSSSANLAFVLASAAAEDLSATRAACSHLLESPELSSRGATHPRSDALYERLQLLETAATLAQRATECREEVERAIVNTMRDGNNPGKLSGEQVRLVRAIARLGSSNGHGALWNFVTKAPEYRVKREAAKALLGAGDAAALATRRQIADTIEAADRFAQDEAVRLPVQTDRGSPFDDLRAVAWLLPGLRSVCEDDEARAELDGYHKRIREFARTLSRQRGLEASIADGLKVDAIRDPLLPPDADARRMLEPGKKRARFWFSRLLLVQAIAIRCSEGDFGEHDWDLVLGAQRDEHPFVREAARLCVRARRTDRWDKYIWEDMTEVAAGGRPRLATVTKQLVADIVIALNLNDLASDAARVRFGKCAQLPACLVSSQHRGEILGWSPPPIDCSARHNGSCMCPYTYHPPAEGIRRELSRAFCRDQRIHAQRLPWHNNVRVKELREFWRQMESLARF